MRKIMTIRANNGVSLLTNSANGKDDILIEKECIISPKLKKELTISMNDNFKFNAYINSYADTKKIEFDFNKNDIMYNALDNLLGKNSFLLIDDDDTHISLSRYIEFYRKDDIISIAFYNQKSKTNYRDDFEVIVRGISDSLKSKGYNNKEKLKLYKFILEARDEIYNTLITKTEKIKSLQKKGNL